MKTCINISFPSKVRFRKKVHSQASDHVWFFLNLFSKRPREKKSLLDLFDMLGVRTTYMLSMNRGGKKSRDFPDSTIQFVDEICVQPLWKCVRLSSLKKRDMFCSLRPFFLLLAKLARLLSSHVC